MREFQHWDRDKVPWSKMTLNTDRANCAVKSSEVVGSHQFDQEEPGLCCVWEDVAFIIVDF